MQWHAMHVGDGRELRAARDLTRRGNMHVILEVDWNVDESLEIARGYLL